MKKILIAATVISVGVMVSVGAISKVNAEGSDGDHHKKSSQQMKANKKDTVQQKSECCKSKDAKIDKNSKSKDTKIDKNSKLKTQTLCPVTGDEIDKNYYADIDGKRIYVCCQMCVAKVKATPNKYIEKMKADGIKLEDIPSK